MSPSNIAFPWNIISIIDHNGTEYIEAIQNIYNPSGPFVELFAAAPLGFTWKFVAEINAPPALPLEAVEKVELGYGYGSRKKIVFNAKSLPPPFDVMKELNSMPTAKFLSKGQPGNISKLVSFSVENFGKVEGVNEHWINGKPMYSYKFVDLNIKNSDYGERTFSLFIFYQTPFGEIVEGGFKNGSDAHFDTGSCAALSNFETRHFVPYTYEHWQGKYIENQNAIRVIFVNGGYYNYNYEKRVYFFDLK